MRFGIQISGKSGRFFHSLEPKESFSFIKACYINALISNRWGEVTEIGGLLEAVTIGDETDVGARMREGGDC